MTLSYHESSPRDHPTGQGTGSKHFGPPRSSCRSGPEASNYSSRSLCCHRRPGQTKYRWRMISGCCCHANVGGSLPYAQESRACHSTASSCRLQSIAAQPTPCWNDAPHHILESSAHALAHSLIWEVFVVYLHSLTERVGRDAVAPATNIEILAQVCCQPRFV